MPTVETYRNPQPSIDPAVSCLTDWLRVIRSEFREIPDLQVTPWQAQRLWNLDAAKCQALLGALVDVGFLRVTTAGAYAMRRRF